jgi:hydroxypyruvate reductase/glycerate 2-kinase
MNAKEILSEIFAAALNSVNPVLLVRGHIDEILSEYTKGGFSQFFIIGFGKASYQMAKAVEESVEGDLITGGIIITKYGHKNSDKLQGTSEGLRENKNSSLIPRHSSLKIYEAGHPIPDENGVKATEEIINLLKSTDKNTFILCLISGGGSALFVSPYGRITLKEKQKVTELLLNTGADINELNAVRKHISKVKGGRLAEIVYPARIIALILSDVVGDRLDVIASGPTFPDSTTFNDALNVLEKFNLIKKTPENVIETLHKGIQGHIPETPKKDNIVFKNVENIIVGNNLKALNAAKAKAESLGFRAEIISSDITGEARDVGRLLAKRAREARDALCVRRDGKKIFLISGGETTVTVKGNGKGGRNMELALSFAMEIEGIKGIMLLSAGTDGTDGPTDAAGAIVNGETVTRAKKLGLDPRKYLNNNDSYNFFKEIDSLLITGPTGTNVMDIQITLIE